MTRDIKPPDQYKLKMCAHSRKSLACVVLRCCQCKLSKISSAKSLECKFLKTAFIFSSDAQSSGEVYCLFCSQNCKALFFLPVKPSLKVKQFALICLEWAGGVHHDQKHGQIKVNLIISKVNLMRVQFKFRVNT